MQFKPKTLLIIAACCMMSLTMFSQSRDNYRSLLLDKNVKIEKTNLPIVFINTNGRMIRTDDYILAKMKILHNGDGSLNFSDTVNFPGQHIDYEGDIALKYRGNSSFSSSDKKPLAFRTLASNVLPVNGGEKQKVKILGMKKDNKWGFIAPWADETMFRDVLSFELGRPWFDWVPSARMCEVILDGTYYGIYALCERTSGGKHRMNLNTPGEDDGDLSGDYHVAIDHGYNPYYASKHHPWQSLDGSRVATWFNIKYEYKDPDNDEFDALPTGTRQALHKEIDKMEDSFMADNWLDENEGYRKYIDVQSFIDYMLATELSMNIDGYRLSTHLYKRSNQRQITESLDPRWKTTLWDYNIAWGNANYYGGDRTDQWQYMMNIYNQGDDCPIPFYWYKMLQDEEYVSALKERWRQYRESNHSTPRIMAVVDSLSTMLKAEGAAERNERAWGIFTRNNIWPLPYYAQDYDDAVDYLKDWIQQRLRFMDKYLLPPRNIETEPIEVSDGWTADIVVEKLPAVNNTSLTIDASNRALYSSQLRSSGGLPADGYIISANENVKYRLQNYTANNALALHRSGEQGTITLSTPIETSELFILATSGNGASTVNVTLHYADGTETNAGTYQIRDWSVRSEQIQGNEAVSGLGNIRRDDNSYSGDNHYCLFDFSVPVDENRLLNAVTFTSQANAYASILALSRIVSTPTDANQSVTIHHHADSQPTSIYSTGGIQQRGLRRGLNVVRFSDGTVKKVISRK